MFFNDLILDIDLPLISTLLAKDNHISSNFSLKLISIKVFIDMFLSSFATSSVARALLSSDTFFDKQKKIFQNNADPKN